MNMSTSPPRPIGVEPLGPKIRRQRRRLGLTLDELSGRTGISKPYLSLIETGRMVNPPSDDKLGRIERTLGFFTGELLTQAHLQRTPRDVRAVLHRLMAGEEASAARDRAGVALPVSSNQPAAGEAGATSQGAASDDGRDAKYFNAVLREMAKKPQLSAGGHAIPVINGELGEYPRGFCDLNNPPRGANEYVSCPDVTDRQAFAARVFDDTMISRYRRGDIVIFSPAASARDGDDCFIRFTDGQTAFRRIFFETGEHELPHIRLQPRNERHRPQTVPSQKIAGLHKAVYVYQRLEEE